MQDRYLGRIQPDMDVCDRDGKKVGTVAHVYRHEFATVGDAAAGEPREDIVEVKTGFLGLGKHLYIPLSAIQDATEGCLFLAQSCDDLDSLGWDQKPAYLSELEAS